MRAFALRPTAHSRGERAPSPYEAGLFLDLAGQVVNRFRSQALVTYAGHPVNLELMRTARVAGVAVVFHLHKFGDNRRGFTDVSAVVFPSAMANEILPLASERGARPETLGDAGFVITIPARCTPTGGVMPTTQEVAPWVAVIERPGTTRSSNRATVSAPGSRHGAETAMRWLKGTRRSC